MSHISEQGLKELAKQEILGQRQVTELSKCESSIYSKAAKIKFNKTAIHSSKSPLDYIRSDLWGPTQTLTHRGCTSYQLLMTSQECCGFMS